MRVAKLRLSGPKHLGICFHGEYYKPKEIPPESELHSAGSGFSRSCLDTTPDVKVNACLDFIGGLSVSRWVFSGLFVGCVCCFFVRHTLVALSNCRNLAISPTENCGSTRRFKKLSARGSPKGIFSTIKSAVGSQDDYGDPPKLYKISITYVRFSFLLNAQIFALSAPRGRNWLKTYILIPGIYCMANWPIPCKSRGGI